MKKVFTVSEFDVITSNENYEKSPFYKFLPGKYFDRLSFFVEKNSITAEGEFVADCLKLQTRKGVGKVISVQNYVGLLKVSGDFELEILPKIDFERTDDEICLTRKTVCAMLACALGVDGIFSGFADLGTYNLDIYELFIRMYISRLEELIKKGLKSDYIQREENLRYFRGKMLVTENLKRNFAHRERIFSSYDEYGIDRPENRIIKFVVEKLIRVCENPDNKRKLKILLEYFEGVGTVYDPRRTLKKVKTDRTMDDYSLIMKWSEMIIKGENVNIFKSNVLGPAMLFPMEKLFESYVARKIKKVFSPAGWGVWTQRSPFYLFDRPKIFRLRPDILARKGNTAVIMDTKWKKLTADPGQNYGISRWDMYQMYAYSKKYAHNYGGDVTVDVWLLYPYYRELKGLGPITFEADDNVRINAAFLNLSDSDCFYDFYKLIENRDRRAV